MSNGTVMSNLPDTKKETAPAKEVTLRRVYALPSDMVDRITDFQKAKGFGSEVEAVRRLLDEALKNRDNVSDLIGRFMTKLRSLRMASEIAKDVLVGHPLVTTLRFESDAVTFVTKDYHTVTITDRGLVEVQDANRNTLHWRVPNDDRFGPGWLSDTPPKVPAFEPGGLDDDIPF